MLPLGELLLLLLLLLLRLLRLRLLRRRLDHIVLTIEKIVDSTPLRV